MGRRPLLGGARRQQQALERQDAEQSWHEQAEAAAAPGKPRCATPQQTEPQMLAAAEDFAWKAGVPEAERQRQDQAAEPQRQERSDVDVPQDLSWRPQAWSPQRRTSEDRISRASKVRSRLPQRQAQTRHGSDAPRDPEGQPGPHTKDEPAASPEDGPLRQHETHPSHAADSAAGGVTYRQIQWEIDGVPAQPVFRGLEEWSTEGLESTHAVEPASAGVPPGVTENPPHDELQDKPDEDLLLLARRDARHRRFARFGWVLLVLVLVLTSVLSLW